MRDNHMESKEFFLNGGNVRLHSKLGFPDEKQEKYPLVIIVHGYTGHMEEPHIAGLSYALEKNGFATLRVEMYGHGKSGGEFRDHTMLKWLSELMDVIDYAKSQEFVSDIYLCGHSQGGLAVILLAAMEFDVVKALVPLSPAISIRSDALSGEIFEVCFDPEHVPDELVFPDGVILSGNHIRVSQMLPIDSSIERYKGPVLIVHGDLDETVPYSCSVEAQKKYADCKLYKVEGANHCYDDHLDEMFNAVVSFLTQIQT